MVRVQYIKNGTKPLANNKGRKENSAAAGGEKGQLSTGKKHNRETDGGRRKEGGKEEENEGKREGEIKKET